MRVSIIISVFNCIDLTRKCLQTLEATLPTGIDCELLLVDDGSTDGSREFISDYSRQNEHCNAVLNERNLGYAASNNRAAGLANGSHLLFLNNDTELTPGWIEPMIAGYHKLRRQRPGMIGNVQRRCSDKQIDHAGVFINSRGKPDHLQVDPATAYPRKAYSEQLATTGACFLIPASVFREVGEFDTEFRNGGEDMDLNFKVRRAGYRIFVANRSCIWHHVSASPGRNDHHERNTCIVFQRWREFLLREGARTWALEYANDPAHRGQFWKDRIYRQCVCMRRGWRKNPPTEATERVDALIQEQEQVWQTMFGADTGNAPVGRR